MMWKLLRIMLSLFLKNIQLLDKWQPNKLVSDQQVSCCNCSKTEAAKQKSFVKIRLMSHVVTFTWSYQSMSVTIMWH